MMKRTSVPMGVVSTRAKIVPGEAEGVVAAHGSRQHQRGARRSSGCHRAARRVPAGIVDVVHVENDALRRPHEALAIEIDPTEPDTGQRAPVGKVLEG